MAKILKALARAKSVEILIALKDGGLKFNQIVEITGNTTTAMRRTRELQTAGLIGRKVLQDKQRSVEYYLTKKGEKVIPLVKALLGYEKAG